MTSHEFDFMKWVRSQEGEERIAEITAERIVCIEDEEIMF